MPNAHPHKLLVAQGGGPTAVINQSLAGVVLEARKFPHIEKVYGALHGIRGIVNEDFVDLTHETSQTLERVAQTPSSALASTRDKPDLEYCRAMFRTVQAHGIGSFFISGAMTAPTRCGSSPNRRMPPITGCAVFISPRP